jgi:VanZ family protein
MASRIGGVLKKEMTAFNDTPRCTSLQTRVRVVFWVLAAIITVLALYPRLTMPELEAIEGMTQYLNHAFAFATLTVVGAIGWGLQRQLIIGVTMGAVALELLQSFSPGRQVTADDLLASLAGVALGYAIAYLALLAFRRGDFRLAPVGPKRRDP